MTSIQVAGEKLELLPEKALYWPAEKILAFSDVHIGKPEAFQKAGIPLPSGAHLEDLQNIEKILEKTHPSKVFILGDLIHHRTSWTREIQTTLEDFFSAHGNIDWTLLIGNHERGSKPFLEKLSLHVVEGDLEYGPFLFSHGHDTGDKKETSYVIQGHIHPVIRLKESAIRLRLPCFVVDRQMLTLPSFGSLTGGYEVSRARGRRIFAVTPSSVFEVPEPGIKKSLEI